MIAEFEIRCVSDDRARAKKRAGKCLTPFCKRPAREGRNYCNTCRDRRWREANPIPALYGRLKAHAKARGKGFTITPAEWEAFCLRTGYDLPGRRPKRC